MDSASEEKVVSRRVVGCDQADCMVRDLLCMVRDLLSNVEDGTGSDERTWIIAGQGEREVPSRAPRSESSFLVST